MHCPSASFACNSVFAWETCTSRCAIRGESGLIALVWHKTQHTHGDFFNQFQKKSCLILAALILLLRSLKCCKWADDGTPASPFLSFCCHGRTSAGSAHSQSSDLLTSSFTLLKAVLHPFSLETTLCMDLNSSSPYLVLGACVTYRQSCIPFIVPGCTRQNAQSLPLEDSLSSPLIAASFPVQFICLQQGLLYTPGMTFRCHFVQQLLSLLTLLKTTFSFYTATSLWQRIIIP